MLNISFALLGKKILPSVQRKFVEQTKGVGELCLCVCTLTDFVLSADQGIVMFIYGWKKTFKDNICDMQKLYITKLEAP